MRGFLRTVRINFEFYSRSRLLGVPIVLASRGSVDRGTLGYTPRTRRFSLMYRIFSENCKMCLHENYMVILAISEKTLI